MKLLFNSLFKWAKPGPMYFRPFLNIMTKFDYINGKIVDEVLGIRTLDRRMVGADESTELWWPPVLIQLCSAGFA